MKLSVNILNRDFTRPIITPQVNIEVTSYVWNARGGTEEANVTCYGTHEELWKLAGYLRCPIEIVDEFNQAVWWGYVHEVTIKDGALGVGISLETMNNKVAALYVRAGADERSVTT